MFSFYGTAITHILGLPYPPSALYNQKMASLEQCFSTAGPRPGTGPRRQLYWAARGSARNCRSSFLSIFHE